MTKSKSSAVILDEDRNHDYNYQSRKGKKNSSRVDINDLLKRIEDTKKLERKKIFTIGLYIILSLLLVSLFIFF